MTEGAQACPKCGRPRQPAAAECPYCGVLYARFRQRGGVAAPPPPPEVSGPGVPAGLATARMPLPAPGPAPAGRPRAPGAAGPAAVVGEGEAGAASGSSRPAHGLDDLYRGPSIEELMAARARGEPVASPAGVAGRGSAPAARPAGPVVEVDTVFTRNLGLSTAIALLFALAALSLFRSHVLGVGEGVASAADRLSEVAGLAAPDGLNEGSAVTFVGHELAFFGEEEGGSQGAVPAVVVLYRRGLLAGDGSGGELLDLAREKLDVLGLHWRIEPGHKLTLAGEPVASEVLSLGPDDNPVGRVVSMVFTSGNGRPALLVVAGPAGRVTTMLRTWR